MEAYLRGNFVNYLKKKRGIIMFKVIDEGFICENCGRKVEPLGYSCRNHCPYCLYSKHVDIEPR